MTNVWIFYRSVIEGEDLFIEDLNIWEHNWKDLGEKIHVKDPLYHQDHNITIYEISTEAKIICFAAGEFSNMIWGIYLNVKS